jgi:HSP20 family protein
MTERKRRDPGLFSGFSKDLERLIRDSFVDGPGALAREGIWTPPTDVYDVEDAVVVRMEIPGVRPGEMDVTVVEDRLVIRGRRREEQTACRTCYRQVEIHSGAFLRVIPLRFPFDRDRIEARYRDGFLYVEVPRRNAAPAESKSFRISVRSGEDE